MVGGISGDVSSERCASPENPFSSFLNVPLLCPCSLRKRLSVSESSHTESDSSPPLTVRRRCCSAIIEMPRFAISSEEEGGQGGASLSRRNCG